MGWKCVLGRGAAKAGRAAGTWGWGWLMYQEQQVAESGLMGWRRRKEEISGTRCTHFIMVPRKLAGYHSRT